VAGVGSNAITGCFLGAFGGDYIDKVAYPPHDRRDRAITMQQFITRMFFPTQ